MTATASVGPAPAGLPPTSPAAVAVRTSPPGSARGRRRLIALGVAAGVLAIAVAALAAMVRFPAPDLENARASEADRPAVGAGSSTVASPSVVIASPSGSSGSEEPINGPIGFDHLRIGALDPSDLRSVRVVGTPEVAAFPTPFDRSLRLPPSSALCLPMPGDTDGGAPSISFDVYLGDAGTNGSIGFSLSPAEADRPAVALAALDGVDREPWYHAMVSDDGDAWVLALTVLDTGVPVIELPLAAEASVADAGPEEACVEWSTPATDTWIFVDNVRVDR